MFFAVALFITLIALFGIGFVSIDLLLFLAFILILGTLIYRDRRKVKLQGIVFTRRTEKGRDTIDNIANRHRRFWSFMATAGVVISIPAMILISAFMINSSYLLLTKQTQEGAARLLLPAPVISPTAAPGILLLPWWIWIIGIAVVVIPHELFHGIMCRLEKIRIRSVGWLLLLFIPGAFVEPDEKQLKKAKRIVKLKVYAAGSFANILTAMVLLLALFSLSGLFVPAGASFRLANDSPAHKANLSGSITEIDGKKILGVEDLQSVLRSKKTGDVVEIKTVGDKGIAPVFSLREPLAPRFGLVADQSRVGTYKITLAEHPKQKERAYLGVDASSFLPAFDFSLAQTLFLYQLLFWVFVFSLGIGLVNLLPIKPLDGGLFFEELVGHFTKETQAIVKVVSATMLILLIFNLVGPWII